MGGKALAGEEEEEEAAAKPEAAGGTTGEVPAAAAALDDVGAPLVGDEELDAAAADEGSGCWAMAIVRATSGDALETPAGRLEGGAGSITHSIH